MMNGEQLFVLVFLSTGMFLSVYRNKLTVEASLTGGLTGYLLFTGTGYAGLIMMTAFFVFGVLATGWGQGSKIEARLSESNKGKRRSSQVLANAGVAAASALLAPVMPDMQSVCLLMVAAAFASATSDTLSSELGNVYGRRFYHIITFQKDRKGENGVISIEGSLAGLVGAALIALIYSTFAGWGSWSWIVLFAGFAGNLFDSVLGAVFERKSLFGNDAVNFLSTLFAALTAALITLF